MRALITELDLDATATELIARESWQLGDHRLVALFDAALGSPARFDAPYWMESALWEAAGVPTVVCGPAGGGLHTDVEWVELDQLTTLHDRAARDHSRMANIALTVNEDGSALLDFSGGGEIRESISLEDVPDGPPALESIVLHFDFYGRLARIEVTDSAASVLPPGLLDQA